MQVGKQRCRPKVTSPAECSISVSDECSFGIFRLHLTIHTLFEDKFASSLFWPLDGAAETQIRSEGADRK
jgi:hypothetical protein